MGENETLDYVLSVLKDKPQPTDQLLLLLVARVAYLQEKNQDCLEIIEILIEDRYITRSSDLGGNQILRITFQGKRFLKSGGYVKQAKDLSNRRFLQSLERILIVIGTLGAGIYGLFEIWKYFCGC